jgi:hypothetical protein
MSWAVTASFYAALHWHDALAYQRLLDPQLKDPGSHMLRNRSWRALVLQIPELREAYREYQVLRALSELARYGGQGPGPGREITVNDVKKAFPALAAIRNAIEGQIPGGSHPDPSG